MGAEGHFSRVSPNHAGCGSGSRGYAADRRRQKDLGGQIAHLASVGGRCFQNTKNHVSNQLTGERIGEFLGKQKGFGYRRGGFFGLLRGERTPPTRLSADFRSAK